MKRREALKNIGLTAGFFVATPSIISLLQSCTAEANTWTPVFLSVEEGVVLTKLVDIILPKTDIPSATEVNVPQFIDQYINEVMEDDQQAQVKTAFGNIISVLKANPEDDINTLKEEDYKALLDDHMLIRGETDSEREANPDSKDMTKSEFLNQLKGFTIHAYRISEEIGENVLVYDPIPGAYFCGDLQELTGGKAWSL